MPGLSDWLSGVPQLLQYSGWHHCYLEEEEERILWCYNLGKTALVLNQDWCMNFYQERFTLFFNRSFLCTLKDNLKKATWQWTGCVMTRPWHLELCNLPAQVDVLPRTHADVSGEAGDSEPVTLWGLTRARPNAGAQPPARVLPLYEAKPPRAAQALRTAAFSACSRVCRSAWNTKPCLFQHSSLFSTPASSRALRRWQYLHLLSFPLGGWEI